jgi:hypothetical protein
MIMKKLVRLKYKENNTWMDLCPFTQAEQTHINTTPFIKNLNPSINTVQKLAQYIDLLTMADQLPWKIAVDTLADLEITYSNPNIGDTVFVKNELRAFVWDGMRWKNPMYFIEGTTSGVTLSFNNSASVQLSLGMVQVFEKPLFLESSTILTLENNLEEGATKKPNTWYFVYVKPSESNPNMPEVFISEIPPSRNQYRSSILPYENYQKYHPTKEARFRGSFKTDENEEIIPFQRVGNECRYLGLGFHFVVQNGNQTEKTAMNVRDWVPVTSKFFQLYYESSTDEGDWKYIGDEMDYFFRFKNGTGAFRCTVLEDHLYYRMDGGAINLGIQGYIEDV